MQVQIRHLHLRWAQVRIPSPTATRTHIETVPMDDPRPAICWRDRDGCHVAKVIRVRDPITMERLFQRLYRIAREVERRPDSLDASLLRLMRELFDPLEVQIVQGEMRHATLRGNGSVLLVPVPHIEGPTLSRRPRTVMLLKHASKGQRLFSSEDARLAERVFEQLHRALSFDQAVEQGRSEERLHIAQDLHDDIGARLLTLMYQAPNAESE